MVNKSNKMGNKNKMMKVSEDLHSKLTIFKKNFDFSTFEDLIQYLINQKNNEFNGGLEIVNKEKYIKSIEDNIFKRLESTHKRLGLFEKKYLTKIIDTSNLLEQFNNNVLKIADGNLKQDNLSSTVELEKKLSEMRELWRLSGNENHKLQEEIRNLKQKNNHIKKLFNHKNSAFSNSYECKLSPDEFEKLFK